MLQCFKGIGNKVKLCRWMSVWDRFWELKDDLSVLAMVFSVLCIENGIIRSMANLPVVDSHGQEVHHEEPNLDAPKATDPMTAQAV